MNVPFNDSPFRNVTKANLEYDYLGLICHLSNLPSNRRYTEFDQDPLSAGYSCSDLGYYHHVVHF